MTKKWFKAQENDTQGTRFELSDFVEQLQFNSDGLIPVITQDQESQEILMFAWMNKEALLETIHTKRMCYWSRSRQSFWRKGESSGHQQQLCRLRVDCDGDVLLAEVEQKGAACHTYRKSCFYYDLDETGAVINSDPGEK